MKNSKNEQNHSKLKFQSDQHPVHIYQAWCTSPKSIHKFIFLNSWLRSSFEIFLDKVMPMASWSHLHSDTWDSDQLICLITLNSGILKEFFPFCNSIPHEKSNLCQSAGRPLCDLELSIFKSMIWVSWFDLKVISFVVCSLTLKFCPWAGGSLQTFPTDRLLKNSPWYIGRPWQWEADIAYEVLNQQNEKSTRNVIPFLS
jgi:hypothetical protein